MHISLKATAATDRYVVALAVYLKKKKKKIFEKKKKKKTDNTK